MSFFGFYKMKKLTTIILIIGIATILPVMSSGYSPLDQSYGKEAATEENRFVTSVIEFSGGGSTDLILGGPRGAGQYQGSCHVVSLGTNNTIIVGFDVTITNGEGYDFIVFENPFEIIGSDGAVFAELTYVEVSTDGINFARFPSISLTQEGGMIFPENVENLAGVNPVFANVDQNDIDPFDPSVAGGDPFDLDDLIDDPAVQSGLVDLNDITFIKLIDIYGDGSCLDSMGNPIYDPTTFGDSGADIDAISVINYEKYQWIGNIRIEGKNETIWDGIVSLEDSIITAYNDSSGMLEDYYISYPSVLGALDEASNIGGFSYYVIYYSSWDAFYVQSIAGESDWWHYWVDYELPMVGCGSYELTENDNEILWGYVEDWYPHVLRIDVDKHDVNRSEEFTVTVYNETMAPVEDAVVYVGSSVYTTNEDGKVTVHIDVVGVYEIYSEKDGYVRSEKALVNVKIKKIVEIIKPEDGTIYVLNRKLMMSIQRILILGPIDIEAKVTDDVEKVEFYINDKLKYVDTEQPFTWRWDEIAFFKKTIKVKAYLDDENYDSDEKEVYIFRFGFFIV